MDQVGPERHCSTTRHHGPASAPGPLLDHLDPAWSTSCNHTLEIADQGGSRWTRRTTSTMELGVGPGALWSCFYILLMYSYLPLLSFLFIDIFSIQTQMKRSGLVFWLFLKYNYSHNTFYIDMLSIIKLQYIPYSIQY